MVIADVSSVIGPESLAVYKSVKRCVSVTFSSEVKEKA